MVSKSRSGGNSRIGTPSREREKSTYREGNVADEELVDLGLGLDRSPASRKRTADRGGQSGEKAS